MRPPTAPPFSRFLLFTRLPLPALPLHAAAADESSFPTNPAPARLDMAPETLEQTDPRSRLKQAAEVANVENLDGYRNGFVIGIKKKHCNEAALLFTRHDVEMGLLNALVVTETPTRGGLAARYRARLSDSQYHVVSLVAVRRQNGYWMISGEKVHEHE